VKCLLVAALVVLTACTRTASLSGCIVGSTPAGEMTVGADAVVIVVPASEPFEAEWQRLVTSFREEYDSARTRYGDTRARYRAARTTEQSARSAQQRASRTPPVSVREDPVTGARVWSNQTPPSVWHAAQARSEAGGAMTEAGRRLNGVIEMHLAGAIAALEKHQVRTIRTDARGCYAMTGMPRERLYVFANHGDRYWFREVDATRTPVTADFTPDRSGWPFAAVVRPG
jgi:hypothetical protein